MVASSVSTNATSDGMPPTSVSLIVGTKSLAAPVAGATSCNVKTFVLFDAQTAKRASFGIRRAASVDRECPPSWTRCAVVSLVSGTVISGGGDGRRRRD